MSAKIFVAFFAGVLLALAGPVVGQTPQPSASPSTEAPAKPRPPLNLKLDEATASTPRITFAPRDDASGKREPANTLPGLGGKPSDSWERPPSEVVPKGSLPGI